ncbi:MAG: pepsin/retropepsin-like aspartic protease family protein [Candidatus Humimicrobiaceae bacterium]
MGKSTISKTPIIKLGFNGFYINCLIDTGAVISMMPSEFGKEFGLDIKKGEPFVVKGIDNINMPSYIHEVNFFIDKYEIKFKVAFSDGFKFPFGLLGREGFFDLFNIAFHQKDGFYEIEPS